MKYINKNEIERRRREWEGNISLYVDKSVMITIVILVIMLLITYNNKKQIYIYIKAHIHTPHKLSLFYLLWISHKRHLRANPPFTYFSLSPYAARHQEQERPSVLACQANPSPVGRPIRSVWCVQTRPRGATMGL